MTRTQSKEITHKIYKKHFGAKAKAPSPQVAKAAEAFRKKVKAEVDSKPRPTQEAIDSGRAVKPMSVSILRLEAQKKGIKYFRVLDKGELESVLSLHAEGKTEDIDKIIATAKARWQAGWGKRQSRKKAA
jgi:hypothetical protein